MDISTLIDRLKTHLDPIINESGSIVFSSVETIAKGDIYTLGLNPGGETYIPLKRIITELPDKKSNAYTDECWGNRKNSSYKMGQHPLQRNFTGLIKAIGYDPSLIFSSNLIFSRSRNQHGAKYPINADLCWPVHQEFIKIVDPRCFIVFGNSKISPFQYIKDKYLLEKIDSIDSGHGRWKCHFFKGVIESKERLLIGLPHLSRYYITYHIEVINCIKSVLSAN